MFQELKKEIAMEMSYLGMRFNSTFTELPMHWNISCFQPDLLISKQASKTPLCLLDCPI